MDPQEAMIAAHICGDGWLTTCLEKHSLHIVNGKRYYQNRIRYEIGYCNTKRELLKEFKEGMSICFNLKPHKVKDELRFRSKRVYKRISELGGGGSRKWFIGKEIINSSKKIKMEWLRAFFDDECTFDPISGRIRIKSMNPKGLKQVKKLLLDLKIKSKITGPNSDKSFYLSIKRKDIPKFYNSIKLKHKLKRGKIIKFLKREGLYYKLK